MSKNNKNIKKEVATKAEIRAVSWQGPLPPPADLQHYEDITPGMADRILSMAENQQKHRIEIENKVINSKNRDSKIGMILGTIIILASFYIAYVCIINDKSLAGLAIVISEITALVGVFLYATISNKKERNERDKY